MIHIRTKECLITKRIYSPEEKNEKHCYDREYKRHNIGSFILEIS